MTANPVMNRIITKDVIQIRGKQVIHSTIFVFWGNELERGQMMGKDKNCGAIILMFVQFSFQEEERCFV